jgi:ribokinase
MITVDEEGQNAIAVASGANMRLQSADVERAWDEIEPPDVLVMPLEVPLECLLTAAKLAQNVGSTVILNPAPARELPDGFLQYINVVVPNETETSILTGSELTDSSMTIAAARKLQSMGVNQIVLTLGASGALILDGEEAAIEIAPHVVDVVDTTAAGDAFVGGLAVAMGEGNSLYDSARMANAAGALATTVMGAQPAMPSRESVLNLLISEGDGL